MAIRPDNTAASLNSGPSHRQCVISVDAMGGDRGPQAVVAGLELSAKDDPDVHFLLHGSLDIITPLLEKHPDLRTRVTLCDAARVVSMDDKPSQIMRRGKGTSMWSALDSVKSGAAQAAVSCGNTGALMAVSMLLLRTLPGVNRPAIACLWPSLKPSGFNIMLDVGAGIEAASDDLLQFATMGASYARSGLTLTAPPRVGLLNVGTEEHKGRAELKAAYSLIEDTAEAGGYEFVGFVEGNDIPSESVDVIVTDGFTGNVALKTGEGTAKLVSSLMRDALHGGILAKLGALLMLKPLRRLRKRMDPRRANGGVFLGLGGTVVKSHGGSDATAISAALNLAIRLARSGFVEQISARIASTAEAQKTAQGDQAAVKAEPPAPSEPTTPQPKQDILDHGI